MPVTSSCDHFGQHSVHSNPGIEIAPRFSKQRLFYNVSSFFSLLSLSYEGNHLIEHWDYPFTFHPNPDAASHGMRMIVQMRPRCCGTGVWNKLSVVRTKQQLIFKTSTKLNSAPSTTNCYHSSLRTRSGVACSGLHSTTLIAEIHFDNCQTPLPSESTSRRLENRVERMNATQY